MKTIPRFRTKSLQTKFLLGLAVITLLGGGLFAGAVYYNLRDVLHQEVAAKASLVLTQARAVQNYVRETLRPTMYDTVGDDAFIIEAMSSSFISRNIMERVELEESEYTYRRVAVNARNPKFEANSLDLELIAYFRANPEKTAWSGYRQLDGEEHYVAARPVRFEKACLRCHGAPEDSPRELIERYGADRGFGHFENEVAGVTAITLPVTDSVARLRGAAFTILSLAVGGALFYFAVANLFFNRLVVHSLRRATDIFPRHFPDDRRTRELARSTAKLETESGDEIEEALAAMERLARGLAEARLELTRYAGNLERMVEERTEALSREAAERRADVTLFVRLLECLNVSRARSELVRSALPEIAKRFAATRAAFVCTMSDRNQYHWPSELHNTPVALPDDWLEGMVERGGVFTPEAAYVPVQSSPDAFEGVLCLFWEEDAVHPEKALDVLRAIGRQLGVAMENLSALNSLVRQKDMLQAVFEGIADPLMLVDGAGRVILGNNAARQITGAESAHEHASLAALMEQSAIHAVQLLTEQGRAQTRAQTMEVEAVGDVLRLTMEKNAPARFELKRPEDRTFAVSVYPLPDVDPFGQSRRAVVYAREVTAEKRLLENMQQHERLVTVGRLAAGLAHEINNPLGVIHCYAELLCESASPQEDAERDSHACDPVQLRSDAEVILNHTRKAQKVLQDLLNYARPRRPGRGPSRPGAIVLATAQVFTPQAEKAGVTLETQVAPDLPTLTVDAEALEQILSNFLLNALDAVSTNREADAAGGRVRLCAGMSERGVFLRVEDDGPGVAAQHMGHIFDPFFTTKEVGRGTGLGLAVVYSLAQEIGGEVRVENNPEGGAVFTLELPLELAEEAKDDAWAEVESTLLRASEDDDTSSASEDEGGPCSLRWTQRKGRDA